MAFNLAGMLSTVAAWWASQAPGLAWKSAVLLALVTVAVRLLRRGSAAGRHSVWTLGLIGVLLLPAVSAVSPGWVVEFPSPVATLAPARADEVVTGAAGQT